MPLFHIDAETLEHLSTQRAMEKLSHWFNPTSGNEGETTCSPGTTVTSACGPP